MAEFLVVDDSHFAHELARAVINSCGHEMLSAYSGKQCLEMLTDITPDCILLDQNMPDMDGILVLEELNKDFPAIPVVMLTADIQDTTRNDCLARGASGVLHKPLQPSDFTAAISGLFDITGTTK